MVAVIVFAKEPVLGTVKTRIAAESDDATAVRLYRELLSQTAEAVEGTAYHVAFGGCRVPSHLSSFFPSARSFYPQSDGDLGVRMRKACERMFELHHEAAVLIGCDCPGRSRAIISSALEAMKENDVVIGPAEDGGYYLVGCTPDSLAIFDAKEWGGPGLFKETIGIAQKAAMRLHILPELYDVDTIEDYRRWRDQ